MIQGIQTQFNNNLEDCNTAVLDSFREQNIHFIARFLDLLTVIQFGCKFSKDITLQGGRYTDIDRFTVPSSTSLCINVRTKMDWQEKYILIINKVSILGAQMLHTVNKQLCRFQELIQDFSRIPIV